MLAWSWRVILGSMIVLELLGALDVLHLQPVFTDLGLIVTAVAVWTALELTRRQMHLWSVVPALLTTALDMTGDYLHWYATIPYYDAMLHAFGSASVAVWLWAVLVRRYGASTPLGILDWLVFTGVVAAGVMYELEEYLEDVFTESNRFGAAFDTGNDLLMNTLGAGVAILLLKLWGQPHGERNHDKTRQRT